MNYNKMHENQNKYIYHIERLKGGGIDRLSWDQIYNMLEKLTEEHPFILQPLSPSDKIVRGRILDSPEKFNNIDVLSHPPAEKCNGYGRCNRPKNPVLYAGVGYELIFSEIGARQGDYVGLLYMSPVQELSCLRLGALDLWRRTNGVCLMHADLKNKIKEIHHEPSNIVAFLLDAFISDYFSRPGSSSVYKLTSAYTSVIMNSIPNIAGLFYDSVDHTAGLCLALKPDVYEASLQPTEVQIVKVTSYLGYGIFDFEQVAFSEKFHGKIIDWS